MSNKRDYYETLGVERGADKNQIKKAYRKQALRFHPDKNPGDKSAEAKFKEASEAAEVLLNEQKRSRYDQFGHAGVDGSAGGGFNGFGGGGEGFSDLGDIFGDIFGDILGGGRGRGGGRRSRQRPGDDLQMSLDVSFEEAAFGAEKKLSVNRKVTCTTCNGSGGEKGSGPATCDMCNGHGEVRRQQGFFVMSSTCPKCQGSGQVISHPCKKCKGDGRIRKKVELSVSVPAGIDSNQRLKLSQEGDVGQNNGSAGDLYVVLHVQKHPFFERDGFDIYCTLPVTFSQAALGDEIEVPTLKSKVALKIPTGTQSGRKMRLKGKGIARLGGYGIGDQIISVHVETPTSLTHEQKEIFRELAQFDKTNCNPMGQGFFEKVKNIFQ